MEDNKITMTQTQFKFDKRAEVYTDSANNYVIPNELTVTITLNEYRQLVSAIANKKAVDAESDKYARLTEIAELKKKVEYLEGIINGKKEDQGHEINE